jgi:hypothetical protein
MLSIIYPTVKLFNNLQYGEEFFVMDAAFIKNEKRTGCM